ncbi:MAG: hypothetical protein MUF34_24335 [Polyangiaceae bacterium]|jgi:hypothetical protein|nr:hypothetical protein [Polyangiaceae bacterium]
MSTTIEAHEPSPEPERGEAARRRAGLRNALIALAVAGVVLWPALQREPRDGFPLSTYPMFSEHRERELSLVHAVASFEGGRREPLPPRFVGTEEVLQARALLRRSVEGGEAEALCTRAAERLRAEGLRGAFAGARAVEVRTDVYDVLSYYETRTPARPGVVHARCPL